jgi:hypothetical protein
MEYTIYRLSKSVVFYVMSFYAGTVGRDKFGGTAWCGVQESTSGWTKSNQTSEDYCFICKEPVERDLASLPCDHSFHPEVRK